MWEIQTGSRRVSSGSTAADVMVSSGMLLRLFELNKRHGISSGEKRMSTPIAVRWLSRSESGL